MSLRSCRIHTTSWVAKKHARYSASMDDIVTIGWSFDIQLTGPPASMMRTPEVDRRVSLSLPQSESQYKQYANVYSNYVGTVSDHTGTSTASHSDHVGCL